ncbi:MAG TPA: alpha/beta fold hydrolase [Chondromyces sp.]|nr:alpha/beta fold hydrolase [Chondromyces sp.]
MRERYAVIPGAESFYIEGNDTAILISHGFVGTPQSVRFLGEELAKRGFTILAPRLKGHGTHYYDMEKCTHEDWFESLEQGFQFLKQRGKRIFVMGQSMGGTLTLKLAAQYKEIEGIILINSALSIPSLEYLKAEQGPRFIPEGAPDIKAKDVFEITYPKVPLKAVHEIQELMEQAPAVFPKVTCPALLIKSAIDHVVPPESTDRIFKTIGSKQKELLVLENSYHVASMDNDKEEIVRQASEFIKQYQVRLDRVI